MSRASFSLHLVLSLAVAVAAARGARAEEVVGAVGAANGTLTGHLPSGPVRTLGPGASVFFKDRISTRHGGSAQLVFLDRSTLNIGANSDVTIDEFVYRPGAGGTMKARLSRGILRFVGGDISHQGGTTIATPAVTIGIRGGIGTVGYLSDARKAAGLPGVPAGFHGGTIVINGYGALTVRNAASEVTITQPGFGVFVGGAGEAIGPPVPIDAATAQILMRAATSQAGQRGGLSARAASLAGLAHAAVAPAPTPAPAPQPILAPNALDFTAIVSGSAALARDRSQARQTVQAIQQLHIATPPASLPISGPPASGSSSPPPGSTGSTSSSGSSSGSTPTGSTSSGGSPPSGPTSSGSSGASGSTSSGGSPPGPAGPGLPPVDPPRGGPAPPPPVTIPVVGPILRGHDNGIGNGGQNNGVGNLGHPSKGPGHG